MTAAAIDFDLDTTGSSIVTIAETVCGEGGYIRERDGVQQYARVRLTIAPHRAGPRSYRFECRDKALPSMMQAAVFNGVTAAIVESFVTSSPVGFVCVSVIEAATDTSEQAILMAAAMAVKDALRRASFVKPQLET